MTSTGMHTPISGGASNNPAPSSQAFALHQRSTNASSATKSSPSSSHDIISNNYEYPISTTSHSYNNQRINNNHNNSMMTPSQYLSRLTDISQMDMQSAFDQMKSLLNPTQIQQLYKLSYYRKQTKGHYARDDPAFVTLQICFLVLSSVAYTIAFNGYSFWKTFLVFLFHSVIINYVLVGFLVATIGQTIANQHMITGNKSNSNNDGSANDVEMVKTAATSNDSVEWMYAFDIHCNAFFPFFIIVYIIQYFILPIVLANTFLSFFLSNTLYSIAFGYYFYVTHLGYRSLSFLSNTEIFLIPVALVVFIFILNLVGYPFGLGWNASRIMAHLYFEA